MGAIYPVLDKELEGIDAASVSGKIINQYNPELGEIARNAGLVPLMNFFGADSGEYFDEDEFEGLEIPDEQLGEKWFEPEAGLKTIEFLLDSVRIDPSEFGSDATALLAELEDFRRVLEKAREASAKWHVAIEI